MPKLRVNSRPLAQCAYPLCTMNFRVWKGRKFCSPRCRKNNWKYEHKPYYAELARARDRQRKRDRRLNRKYQWAVEGQEDVVPEHLTVSEAVAGASPDTITKIKEYLGIEEVQNE